MNKWMNIVFAEGHFQGSGWLADPEGCDCQHIGGKESFQKMVPFPCLFRVWPELPIRCAVVVGGGEAGLRCWWDPWVIWQHYEVLGSWEKSAWKRIISVLCVVALRELTFLSLQLIFFLPVSFFISLFRWKSSNLSVVFPHASTLPELLTDEKRSFLDFTESSSYLQWNCFFFFFSSGHLSLS